MNRTMKLTRHRLMGGIGAAVVAILMAFTGLTPVGADVPDWCEANAGTTITWRDGRCVDRAPDLSLEARRYSKDTGEVMWDRVSGAAGYEILQNGKSLGVHDVLSWYVTGLEEYSSYSFDVRAVDGNGNYIGSNDSATIYLHYQTLLRIYQGIS